MDGDLTTISTFGWFANSGQGLTSVSTFGWDLDAIVALGDPDIVFIDLCLRRNLELDMEL